jgi:RNA polymerase sigma-70 factor (ECF subfamily)
MTDHDAGPISTSPEPASGGELDMLLLAVARGEHGAFDLVYERLRRRIDSRVRAVLPDHAQVEEVTQEVLLEVWRNSVRYDPAKGSAASWALTIAHRRAVDRVRSAAAASAREQRIAAPPTLHDDVSEAVEDAFDRELLRSSLDQLSGLQREAIVLAFYGGNSYARVASILGVPLGTVKARIRDGLLRLRASLLGDESECG